jgi:hypothetical protein
MGVLDGRCPSSMGSTGKDLEARFGEPSPAWWVLGGRWEAWPLELSVRASTSGTDRRLSISSSSSMEGKVWLNSTGVRKDVRGEEEVEDVGDGGPRAEGDTKEWDVGGVFDNFDDADALWLMGGDNRERDCREFLVVRVPSEDVDVGESGTAVVVGSSLETRLAVLTDNPASCNDRIRSAMLPPDSFCTPFSGGGERCPLSLEGTCKQIEAGDGSRPTA